MVAGRDLHGGAMDRKKLPIGVQTFREIREGGYYYVDKTGYASRLVDEGRTYFLSRPRRFGKSLFVDTLAELFAGNRALFEGLACYDTWDWETTYPVVSISFGSGVVTDPDMLERRIRRQLDDNAARLGVGPLRDDDVVDAFISLIRAAETAHGQRVVVLVDEYDKPILDNITKPELSRQMRDGLRNLYSVVKDQDAHIKFVLLTGVSKFSKVSIFSGLNNLNDITIDPQYSAVCGYTDHDVDTVFAPELDGLDRDEIRDWYNGYSWTGEAVYNPFDLLLLFSKRRFQSYWFETGTPTFLVDTLTEQRFYLPDLQNIEATEALLSSFDVGDISPTALLFQTGYLTIAATRLVAGAQRYPRAGPAPAAQVSTGPRRRRMWVSWRGIHGTTAPARGRGRTASTSPEGEAAKTRPPGSRRSRRARTWRRRVRTSAASSRICLIPARLTPSSWDRRWISRSVATSRAEYRRPRPRVRPGQTRPNRSYWRSVCGCIPAICAATEIANTGVSSSGRSPRTVLLRQ